MKVDWIENNEALRYLRDCAAAARNDRIRNGYEIEVVQGDPVPPAPFGTSWQKVKRDVGVIFDGRPRIRMILRVTS